jgi:hypothetical protein
VPFIRVKYIKGREYRYLVEGVREHGKVRQRVIVYLGEHETVQAAYDYWRGQVKGAKDVDAKQHARDMVAKLKPYL